MTTISTVTPFSVAAPTRADPTTFSSRGDTIMTEMVAMVPDINTTVGEMNAVAGEVNANAAAAATSETNAAASATAAAVTANAARWIAGTYALDANAISPLDGQTYRNYVSAGVRNIDPKNDPTNWVKLSGTAPPTLVRSARTANTILGAADTSTLIDITSGTFTQTFDAAATLDDGWFVYLRNSGTGDITLDPNGAELIDGLTSYIMYPGEVRLVQCDGTALRSVVVNAFYKTFTSSGTFTKPPGYALFSGLLWSGGNSGSRHSSNPRGGGGGGCAPFSLSATVFGATETITIGAGGAPYTGTLDDTGNVGGLSSIGSLVVLTVSTSVDSPSKFGVGLGTGWDGGAGSTGSTVGTSSIYGGAGGSGYTAAAGTSKYGGNGGLGVSGANGIAGTAPGGGGGGSVIGGTSTQSGAGARGELRIWGIA